jgi:beta-phosphoglucomutase-like phosphatase (HAD superfamily)
MPSLDLMQYSFAALIFDCDGTLADTSAVHYRSLDRALRAQGLSLDRAWYMERLGVSRSELLRDYERTFHAGLDRPAIELSSDEYFPTIAHEVEEITEVADIARRYRGFMPMAVASGGQRVFVEATLRACGLIDLFDTIVTFNDVAEGKPSPALFLEAARRLLVEPEQCLVLEDSEQGLEAASRAKMQAIDVRRVIRLP